MQPIRHKNSLTVYKPREYRMWRNIGVYLQHVACWQHLIISPNVCDRNLTWDFFVTNNTPFLPNYFWKISKACKTKKTTAGSRFTLILVRPSSLVSTYVPLSIVCACLLQIYIGYIRIHANAYTTLSYLANHIVDIFSTCLCDGIKSRLVAHVKIYSFYLAFACVLEKSAYASRLHCLLNVENSTNEDRLDNSKF